MLIPKTRTELSKANFFFPGAGCGLRHPPTQHHDLKWTPGVRGPCTLARVSATPRACHQQRLKGETPGLLPKGRAQVFRKVALHGDILHGDFLGQERSLS